MTDQEIIDSYYEYKSDYANGGGQGISLEDYFVPEIERRPEALKIVLDLFNQEEETQFKLLLSNTLIKFQCKQIIPSLKSILLNKDLDDRFDAAYALVALNEDAGRIVLLELAKHNYPGLSRDQYVTRTVLELHNIDNELARQTIKELSGGKTYEEVVRPIHEAWIQRLKEMPDLLHQLKTVSLYRAIRGRSKRYLLPSFEADVKAMMPLTIVEMYGMQCLFERERSSFHKVQLALILAKLGDQKGREYLKKIINKIFYRLFGPLDIRCFASLGLICFQDPDGGKVLREILPKIIDNKVLVDKILWNLNDINNPMAHGLIGYIQDMQKKQ